MAESTLTLLSYPADKHARVLKTLRDVADLSLAEAKQVTDIIPAVVKTFDVQTDAEAAYKALLEAGVDCMLGSPPAEGAPSLQSLCSAASLLRVAVSAFGETSEPTWGDATLDDILEVTLTAKTRIQKWLSQMSSENASGAFDALDLLTLAQAAIVSGLNLSTEQTVSPIRCAIKMAAEALARVVADNQPESREAEQEAA